MIRLWPWATNICKLIQMHVWQKSKYCVFWLFYLTPANNIWKVNCWILLSFMVRNLDDIWNFYGISNLSCIQVLHRNSFISSIANSRLLMSKIALTTKVIRILTNIQFSDKQKNIPGNSLIIVERGHTNDLVPSFQVVFKFSEDWHATFSFYF